jgi:hypothetical protein
MNRETIDKNGETVGDVVRECYAGKFQAVVRSEGRAVLV